MLTKSKGRESGAEGAECTVGYLLASDKRGEVHAYDICSTFLSDVTNA
jgi:hypothetical protein